MSNTNPLEQLRRYHIKKYKKELENAFRDNVVYLNKNYKKIKKIYYSETGRKKTVIPSFNKTPKYFHFSACSEFVFIERECGLRYIPYIPGENTIQDITEFNEDEFKRPVIDFEFEISNRFIQFVFQKYTPEIFYSIKKKIENNIDLKSSEDKELESISKFLNITVQNIISRWESYFEENHVQIQRYQGKNIFSKYFCNICFSFDCSLHTKKTKSYVKRK
ncbi:hypothetical protein EDEG_00492 [Edhazardia aedis USNM 41457]|uniref:Uncharacterized protein n=1 Tax=Edhazardia aedis (strain USNM 41457) TaxID=1003232 RepID=J9DIV3_EDHAE|nr:hypothetical protein EDEG_00492 [Edhazardia aedis USNM 41457]|eukprot:EJW01307.1 hypothetical protein EDEG_00492 [Edhazardia aedis USNM 41457]